MPSKGKAASKTKASETSKPPPQTTATATTSTTANDTTSPPPPDQPLLLIDRSRARFALARPLDHKLHQLQLQHLPQQQQQQQSHSHSHQERGSAGLSSLLPAHDRTLWLATRIASRLARRPALAAAASTGTASGGSGGGGSSSSSGAVARLACGGGSKTLKEVWKVVNEGGVPLRVRRPTRYQAVSASSEGEEGRGLHQQSAGPGPGLTARDFEARWERKVLLSCLAVESRGFRERAAREKRGEREVNRGEKVVVTEQETFEETRRRKEMATLKRELYGGGVGGEGGKLATDPEWDDVTPVVLEEPEGALAAISYSADYAEAMAYLRAVMQANEHSPRCLRLTEHIIGMNPAHYTVWLYRAANVFALQLPILDEIAWLNRVALQNLKNYQIWHHRHLLVENYYPTLMASTSSTDPSTTTITTFAASERSFLRQILSADTKNYHVWSYRSYLVNKLSLFADPDELRDVERLVDDDVRNNSAWSHRFFLVFSDPAYATPGLAATEADPGVPAEVVDREVAYAEGKIRLAPQSQSGWNYLRGVLVKGGRGLRTVEEFAGEFVTGLGSEGEEEEEEEVQSTHALDLLAEIWAEKGEREKAELGLRRLGQKWDRIRVGYWEWRLKCLEVPA